MEGVPSVSCRERFAEPSPALPPGGEEVLTEDQENSWRRQGFALVDGVLPEELVGTYLEGASGRFPECGTEESKAYFEFQKGLQFPCDVPGMNEATFHPRLLGSIAQLLQCPVSHLRITQSHLWAKYGQELDQDCNQDQHIHMDYGNHTITHPPPWHRPEAVELIVYLSSVDECGGGTSVAPREGKDDPIYKWPLVNGPGLQDYKWISNKDKAEELFDPEVAALRQKAYDREKYSRFKPGTVLYYRHDTWHRGTPMVPGSRRLAHNLTFCKSDCNWISTLQIQLAWAAYGDAKVLERFIATASLDQRAVMGIPPPGHAFWTPKTIEGMAARFGPFNIDMAPYLEALPPTAPEDEESEAEQWWSSQQQ